MGLSVTYRGDSTVTFARNELTGAIGDSVTVLPVVVAVAVLTDLSLAVMLVWFGVFQIVWGLYYGAPVSVEPMKALAALVVAGAITTGELLLAGMLLGAVLLGLGATRTLARVEAYVGNPVVRGVQFGVALVLLETGIRLGIADLGVAALAVGIAVFLFATGYRNLAPLIVLGAGGLLAGYQTGLPAPALPSSDGVLLVVGAGVTAQTVEATVATGDDRRERRPGRVGAPG